MLAGGRPGGQVRAYQQLVVARRLAQTPDDGPLLNVLPEMVNLVKIADGLSPVISVAFSPDGQRIASGSADNPCGCGTPPPANPRPAADRPHRRGVQCGV